MADDVNQPAHYTETEIPFECIEVAECMSYPLGCAFKYVFRAGYKDFLVKDLLKATWYINRQLRTQRNGIIAQLPCQHLETLHSLSKHSQRAKILLAICSLNVADYVTAKHFIYQWIKTEEEAKQ